MLKSFAIVAVAAAVFLFTLRISIAGAYGDSSPARALAWAPFDANAQANWAALVLSASRDPAVRAQARSLAADAIGRDPTRVVALRALALAADADGNRQLARGLMGESERLSRRDQLTQVWLVGYYNQRGDVAGMIRHFDTALRTSNRSKDLLYSVLANASSDPRFVEPLAAKLREKPDWWLGFTAEFVLRAPQLRHVVAVTRGLLDPAVREERIVIESLLQRLTTAEEYDLAWQMYGELMRGQASASQATLIRNGGIESLEGLIPFDWLVMRDPDLGAERRARPDSRPGNALFLISQDGRSGDVASQLLRLPPGGYRLNLDMGAIPEDPLARPGVRIACADGARATLLDLRPNVSRIPPLRLGGNFAVSAGCRWQWLTVRVGGEEEESEAAPWIDNLTIVRASS